MNRLSHRHGTVSRAHAVIIACIAFSVSSHAAASSGSLLSEDSWNRVEGEPSTEFIEESIVVKLTGTPPPPVYYQQKQESGEEPAPVMYSKASFPRTRENDVLRLTMSVRLSPYAYFTSGFFPADAPEPSTADLQYGFHGNRLDRAIWFMQGPRLMSPDQNEPMSARLLRLEDPPIDYQSYRVRVELGAESGALWLYDFGKGWKTGRDTRGLDQGDRSDMYSVVLSSAFYGDGELIVDAMEIDYVPASEARELDQPEWGPPVDANFEGAMDPGWTNWAGDLGAWWAVPSTADFSSVPGWITLHGPEGGFGLHLRHYPFLPESAAPFAVETRLRYPLIDPPDANYMVMASLQLDVDEDLLTDDIAYVSLLVQNIEEAGRTEVQVFTMSAAGQNAFLDCAKPLTALADTWSEGDLFMRIELSDPQTLKFRYRFSAEDPWVDFYEYRSEDGKKSLGMPIGFDLIGPCKNSKWAMPPEPQSAAEEVSFEVDYIRFETTGAGDEEM